MGRDKVGERGGKKMTQNYINWLSYENKVELGNKTPTNVVLKIIIKPNQKTPNPSSQYRQLRYFCV